MAAILTDKFRVLLAERFKERITLDEDDSSKSGLWLFFARPRPWEDNDGNEVNTPENPVDNLETEFEIFDYIIGLKKVPPSEVRQVIRNNKWVSGKLYDYYRHDYGSVIDRTQNQGNTIVYQTGISNEAKLYETNHYVVTSEYKVYKCLDNANNSSSTVEPSSTSPSPFILGDGYTWKYMFTVNASDFEKFKSDEYVPVPEISEVTNRINASSNYGGAIYKVDIKTPGGGYSTGDIFNVIGDGTNAQVRVTTVDATNGGVTGVKIINPGTSYTYGQIDSTVVVNSQNGEQAGTGTGADLTPIISTKEGIAVDFAKELGANRIALHARLEPDDFVFKNDFTVVGVILNPQFTGNPTSTAIGTHVLTLDAELPNITEPSSLEDKLIRVTGGNADVPKATGTVVQYEDDGVTRRIYFLQENIYNSGLDSRGVRTPFERNDNIAIESITSGSIVDSANAVSAPQLIRGSGDIIYIDNRNKISRADDQTEDFKIILEF